MPMLRLLASPPLRHGQGGMSLFPSMMFLLVLAMLGVAALNSTLLQEKMAGNTRDTNVAFQAAEAALRDAESDVALNITPGTVFSASCSTGLCTPPSTWASPTSQDISKLVDWTDTGSRRVYGSQTGVAALPDVAAQPLYVIEKLSGLPVGPGGSAGIGINAPPSGGAAYRLTVLATGVRAETHVILQSTFLVTQ
ncbi:MAG TPA: PilX N-terminal domain-containing pilus assembly protein [Casimicrobiaceae bacterium]|nr:PilX N-terminal domain-containing pilus assembly protein [Casimicrobiaceae bacterium]